MNIVLKYYTISKAVLDFRVGQFFFSVKIILDDRFFFQGLCSVTQGKYLQTRLFSTFFRGHKQIQFNWRPVVHFAISCRSIIVFECIIIELKKFLYQLYSNMEHTDYVIWTVAYLGIGPRILKNGKKSPAPRFMFFYMQHLHTWTSDS